MVKQRKISGLGLLLLCVGTLPQGALATESRTTVAEILSPVNLGLESGAVSVSISVGPSEDISWTLSDSNSETGNSTVLASGTGPVDGEVFSGSLAVGFHQLSLEYTDGGILSQRTREFAVAPEQHSGFPYDSGMLASDSGRGWCPEASTNSGYLIRSVQGGRQQVELMELVRVGADGQSLDGWPLDFAQESFALSEFSTPLLLDATDQSDLLIAGKSELLRVSPDGLILQRTNFTGSLAGSALLEMLPEGSPIIRLTVNTGSSLELLSFDANLNFLGAIPFAGDLALGHPLLADFTSDGTADIVLALNQGAHLEILLIDGVDNSQTSMAVLADCQPEGWMAGDLDGDMRSDLVLSDRFGKVYFLDQDGLRWEREYPLSLFSAPALVELYSNGDHQVLISRHRPGVGAELLALDAQGHELSNLSGLSLSDRHSVRHAPQFLKDDRGEDLLILPLAAPLNEAGSACVKAMSLSGHVEGEWYLSSSLPEAPRIVDMDQDGQLDLLLVDGMGRVCNWPLERQALLAPHPYGDLHHSGRSVQPIAAGVEPALLNGAVRLSAQAIMPVNQVWVNVCLLDGMLDLARQPRINGAIRVGPDGSLTSGLGHDWSGDSTLRIELEGRFHAGGTLPPNWEHENNRTRNADDLFSEINLNMRRGSVLSLEQCVLEQPFAWMQLGPERRIELKQSWLLKNTGGLVLNQAVLDAEQSLIQGAEYGMRLEESSRAILRDCVVTGADSTGIQSLASALELNHCTFLANGTALKLSAGSVSELDSVHFQGNGIDLTVQDAFASLSIQACDFQESHVVGIENLSHVEVLAQNCFWDTLLPAVGDVDRSNPLPHAVLPTVVPSPVFNVGTGPMVDGDEPLEWDPVEVSVDGIPIDVYYIVYRSDDAYDVWRPENQIAVTSNTWFRDSEHFGKSFYCVTVAIGTPDVY